MGAGNNDSSRRLFPQTAIYVPTVFFLFTPLFSLSFREFFPLPSLPNPTKTLPLPLLVRLGNASHHLPLSETFGQDLDTYLPGYG